MITSSLIFNHQRYAGKELEQFSKNKILDDGIPAWEKDIFRFILNWLDDSDSIIQYSSGTTGQSRKIHLPKISMIRSAENTCKFFDLTGGTTAVLCLPVKYIAGKMMVVRSMVANMNLLVTEPKSLPDFSGIDSADFCAMVPLQVFNVVKNRESPVPVRRLLIGGAEITPGLIQLVQPFASEVFAGFGMAETCSHVALRRLNGHDRQEDYHALSGISLTSDERGCLVIMAEYLPQKIITNDLVQFTGPSSFIWLGRYDNLINSGGIKIVPEEVEAAVMAKAGLECTVVGLPDERFGQELVMVLEKDKAPDDISQLKNNLKSLLPAHWLPKKVFRVGKLPRNDSFKIDRKRLSELIARNYQ
jgi:O-succinylbenzoic acid--CoA ligase